MAIEKTMTEFFAGVGGFRVGLEKADPSWQTKFFSQYEPGRKNQFAYDCYVRNFGLEGIEHPELTNVDINDVDKSVLPATNLLTTRRRGSCGTSSSTRSTRSTSRSVCSRTSTACSPPRMPSPGATSG